MALTYLKNAKVEKAFNGGKGYAVSENYRGRDGNERSTRWSIWFDEPTALAEGSTVDVSGLHSDKVREFEGDNGTVRIVERSLNSARVTSQTTDSDDSPF